MAHSDHNAIAFGPSNRSLTLPTIQHLAHNLGAPSTTCYLLYSSLLTEPPALASDRRGPEACEVEHQRHAKTGHNFDTSQQCHTPGEGSSTLLLDVVENNHFV